MSISLPWNRIPCVGRRHWKYAVLAGAAGLTCGFLILGLGGCSGSDSTKPMDVTAPAAVTDLNATPSGSGSVMLRWHAPGDDGIVGRAQRYDLRLSTVEITAENWALASVVPQVPPPASSQEPESLLVSSLKPSWRYFFALKSEDEAGNTSDLSNVAQVVTSAAPDSIAPAAITTLEVFSSTGNSITLVWQAVGDDSTLGTAARYDLRHALDSLTVIHWESADAVLNMPAPKPAGQMESFIVPHLKRDALYYFGIRTADEAGRWSPTSNIVRGRTTNPPSI